jgi:hypothetical protein
MIAPRLIAAMLDPNLYLQEFARQNHESGGAEYFVARPSDALARPPLLHAEFHIARLSADASSRKKGLARRAAAADATKRAGARVSGREQKKEKAQKKPRVERGANGAVRGDRTKRRENTVTPASTGLTWRTPHSKRHSPSSARRT